MTSPSFAQERKQPTSSLFTIGPGWVWPAVLVGLAVALIYVPGHHASAGALDGLIASVGGLYVIGISVVLVRVARGAILRLAGSSAPIVILGSGPETATDVRIRARWRLAAVLGGTLVAAGGILASGWLSSQAGPSTYAHALATLGLGTNLALAAAILVPAPGFAGWGLVVALVDAAATPVDRRIRRAAALARIIGVPIAGALVVAALALGDPMLVLLGVMLTMFISMQSGLAVGHDVIARFLLGRVAGDLARPLDSHADADEPVEGLVARLPAMTVVTAVEASGALVGAIGPLQLGARDRMRGGQRAADVMVGLAQLPLLPASTAGADVLAAIARYGFALVRAEHGLAYVEANDLLAQIQAGVAPPSGAEGHRPSGGSGALGDHERDHDHRH